MLIKQAPVVQRLNNAIHSINCYLVNGAVRFPSSYPLDRDLSIGIVLSTL